MPQDRRALPPPGPYDCGKCGKVHPKGCQGHLQRDKTRPCGQPPLIGGKVCKFHGGMSPRALAGAARRVAEAEAERANLRYGIRRDVSPSEALLEEIQWTAGHVEWIRGKVQAIEADLDVVWGETKTVVRSPGEGAGEDAPPSMTETTEAAALNAWITLYQKERAHLARMCAEAIRAGIEDRKVKLAERQGQLVADVIGRILTDLGLTREQQALVSEVVPRHLRLLVTAPAAS